MINDIDKNLDNILEIAENLPKVTKDTSPRVMPEINGMEEDTDFKYTRENLYNLLERGQEIHLEGQHRAQRRCPLQCARRDQHFSQDLLPRWVPTPSGL